MKRTCLLIFLIQVLNLSIPQTASASINLVNLDVKQTGYLGAPHAAKISLRSSSGISVSAFLRNSNYETINGVLTSIPKNRKNGTWTFSFLLENNARTGDYQLFIKAKTKKHSWQNPKKIITFLRNTTNYKNDGKATEERSNNSQVNSGGIEPYNAITMSHMKSLPTFVRGLNQTCTLGINCPEVTKSDSLLNPISCKISDATYPDDSSEGYVSSAFPPAKFSLAGQQYVKLLWIPVNFKDRKIGEEYRSKAVKTAQDAENFYSYNSFGRIQFDFEVLDEGTSINLPENYSYYEKKWANRETDITQFLLDNVRYNSITRPDAITWLFPEGKYSLPNKSFNGRTKMFSLGSFEIPAARVYGLHQEIQGGGVEGYAHGVGHALYSFEDLYIFSGYLSPGMTDKPASYWDLMGGGGEFYSWSKWIAGWLKDSEVNCLAPKKEISTLELSPFQDPVGKKLIAIPINEFKIVLAEYRTNMAESYLEKFGVCQANGITQCESRYAHSGLLIYTLDTRIKHGAAPFRVAQQTGQPLLTTGQTLEYEGILFRVEAASDQSIFVQVSKS